MQTVASILLLVTVASTVQAADISGNLDRPPLQDHMYLFDITTEASVDSVKLAFKDFTIDQSFKIIGEKRMFIALRSNSTAQLRRLTFPAGSKVTQYPSEHIKEFLDLYGAGAGWEEDYTQKIKMNTIYTILDWELLLPSSDVMSVLWAGGFVSTETVCTTAFAITLRAWSKAFRKTHGILKPLSYPLLATYPPRILFLIKWEENALQNSIKQGFDIWGGPDTATLKIKRAVRV